MFNWPKRPVDIDKLRQTWGHLNLGGSAEKETATTGGISHRQPRGGGFDQAVQPCRQT